MASFVEKEDSSEDEFSDNFKLTERLRINRERKLGLRKKNYLDDQSSSSSSIEMHNEPSRAYSSYNKKRQNGDKNIDQFANPKRTCLSDRLLRSPGYQYKKKSSTNHFQKTDFLQCPTDSKSKHLCADKTYEEHSCNLAAGDNPSFNSSKQYSKKRILNNFADHSRSVDEIACISPDITDEYKAQNDQNKLSRAKNCISDFLWRSPVNNVEEQLKPVHNRSIRPISYINQLNPDYYTNSSPNVSDKSIVHCVDSASDEDSRSIIKSGSLKGGRQSPDLLEGHKKVVGRKVIKKVLESDDTDEDWSSKPHPKSCIIFSSSDSETESNMIGIKKSPVLSKSNVNHLLSVEESVNSTNKLCNSPDESTSCSKDKCYPNSSPYFSPSKLPRSYQSRKNSRSHASLNLSPNGFYSNRSVANAVRGRSRVNVGERYATRSGSPHPGTLPNSHPRITRSDTSKSTRGRSLTGSHSRRANANLATAYPDLFDTEDSSEVEFFTANSYSDTETSAESFGGLRISSSVRNPDNDELCEHSINIASSEDEISVVFSSGPSNRDPGIERPTVRNGESRRGSSRTLGRRSKRGSRRQLHNSVQEIVSLSPDPVEQVRQVEEDERFAIMLQAQFDAETDHNYTPQRTRTEPGSSLVQMSVQMSESEQESNEFDWSIDSESPYRSRRNFRINRVPIRPTTPNFFGSLFYHNRRLDRNHRRATSSNAQNFARLFETAVFDIPLDDIFYSDDSYEAFLGIAELNGDVPRGLQKSEINRLPTRQFFIVSDAGSSTDLPHKRVGLNKECQVCLSDYVNGDTLRILPCFHEFHTPCIDPWLKINHTCPVCRVVVDLGS